MYTSHLAGLRQELVRCHADLTFPYNTSSSLTLNRWEPALEIY